jgi:acetate kinase
MHVLVVNAGSSSLRLRLLGPRDEVLADAHWAELIGGAPREEIAGFLDGLEAPVDAVGHRVVHGGAERADPVVVDDPTVRALEALTSLAPLHQPSAIAAMRLVTSLRPGITAVACFDTAFHVTMPAAASTYALPAAWRARWGLRRFGFHGLSHAWASRRAAELLGERVPDALRVVVCHLGAGASLCGTVGGVSVDTTMGFTPLEGLVMATRSGSVDPGLLLWLLDEGGLTTREIEVGLTRAGGLAGLGGGTGAMRDVVARRASGDPAAILAFDVYVHRLAQGIAAMAASTGGLDALVFTGGVGEHEPEVRAAAAAAVSFLGVALDPVANDRVTGDARIDERGAAAAVFVVEAREDLEIARQVRSLLSGGHDQIRA